MSSVCTFSCDVFGDSGISGHVRKELSRQMVCESPCIELQTSSFAKRMAFQVDSR